MLSRRVTLAAALVFLAFLASPSTQDAVIAPNENLITDGIPDTPQSVADKAARYTEFRTATLQSWHPTRREMLITTRFADTNQVHVVRQPLGARRQVTFFPDPVIDAKFEPQSGSHFVFSKDVGGSEWYQLYRYDVKTADIALLTDGKSRNEDVRFNHQGTAIAYDSTRRNGVDSDIWVMDPANPKSDRLLMQGQGLWFPTDWSHSGKWLVVNEFVSEEERYLWIVDAETGLRQPIVERNGPKALYADAQFSADDSGLFMLSNNGSEFLQLTYVDLATRKQAPLTGSIPWDVDEFTLTRDGRRIAFDTNEDGLSKLYVMDTATREFKAVPGIPPGVISGLTWHANSRELAFNLNGARTPTDVYSYDAETATMTRWTDSETGGVDTTDFPDPQLISWNSFDGKRITGFLYMPPTAKFPGRRPVIVSVHGGPEGQSRPVFIGRNNYFLNEMGVAIVYPNVRGSTGYGKSFLAADNGFHREDSYKDMAALFDWIKQDPRFDGERILVTGVSYGGHMTLVAATHYSDKIRCTIDVVGISNLVTFLEHTESYRRDQRRAEYGDERDPKMREYQESVAPMNRVKNVTRPMFIIAGKNDPRVPISESDQIAAAVKANGVPRWYLVAKDEGHGYTKRKNQDFQFHATVQFIQSYLLN